MAKKKSICLIHELPRVTDLQLLGVTYIPAKTLWSRRRFDIYCVTLIASGKGEYQLDGGLPQQIRPGTQMTFFPGPIFTHGPRETNWEEYCIAFKGAAVQRWIDAGWFPTDGLIHPLVDIAPLVTRFRELLRIMEHPGPGDADRALPMTERLLIEMYYNRAAVREAKTLSPSIEAALLHCHEHFTEEIDFDALAQSYTMSYSHLRHQITNVTGMPPHQYVIRLRCEAAKDLLSATDMTNKEIAAKIGIPDQNTFSRTFTRCVGISPAQYRRQFAPWSSR